MKNAVDNFLEEKNDLPEKRDLLCDNNWLFDMAFLVDVTSHINDLNLKLQGKSKLFPSLVNDINAFNMKLTMFVSQMENEDLCQSPHLKEQSECAAGHGSLARYTEKKTSYCRSHLKVIFMILVKKKAAYTLLETHFYLENKK